MDTKRITIFTPTYNRKKILRELYNSLISQSSKQFIWLIVDDGSTDNTKEEVDSFISDNKITIEYFYKENGGKYTAHNLAVNMCHTDYFFIVDSDDILSEDAIEVLNKEINVIDSKDSISGIIGPKCDKSGKIIGKEMPNKLTYATGIELYEKYNVKGDTLRLYKTDILKKNPFPNVYGEKFMPENIVFDKIDDIYKMYIIRDKLYFCEYQNDGYSNNIASYHLKSPLSYAMGLESSAFYSKKIKSKIKWTILLQLWCGNIKTIDSFKLSRNKIIYYCCKPISKIFGIFKFPKFMFTDLNNNKVAIVTLYGNYNFGNKLQNYALQKTINNFGLNAETIKCKYRYLDLLKNIKILIGGTIKNILKPCSYHRKVIAFKNFNKKYIRYSKQFVKTNDTQNRKIKGYNYYIYGSDQIWNPSCFGNSQLFLGYKSESEKNIAYAASFGISKLPNELEKNYISGFSNFNMIALREFQGKKIVDDLEKSNRSKVVLDPTLLLKREEWNKIIDNTIKINNKYILCYFLGKLSCNQKLEIERVAIENNYKIIDLMDTKSKYYSSNPSDFLYLIKNAELICTDSYHACVFSLIYDKSFIIFQRNQTNGENMYSRIETLLSMFKLENRKFNNQKISSNNLEHDYTEAYKILEKERSISEEFLKSALKIK